MGTPTQSSDTAQSGQQAAGLPKVMEVHIDDLILGRRDFVLKDQHIDVQVAVMKGALNELLYLGIPFTQPFGKYLSWISPSILSFSKVKDGPHHGRHLSEDVQVLKLDESFFSHSQKENQEPGLIKQNFFIRIESGDCCQLVVLELTSDMHPEFNHLVNDTNPSKAEVRYATDEDFIRLIEAKLLSSYFAAVTKVLHGQLIRIRELEQAALTNLRTLGEICAKGNVDINTY